MNKNTASSLYADGWRANEWRQLKDEFELSDDEAIDLSHELAEIELDDCWNGIVGLMDPDIRETVHQKLAPCENIEFLEMYSNIDEAADGDFLHWLYQEYPNVYGLLI